MRIVRVKVDMEAPTMVNSEADIVIIKIKKEWKEWGKNEKRARWS
jgi:hypothetical protein